MDTLGLDPAVVRRILRDAASHAGVPVASARLQRVERSRWPSSALGCPEPGMVYVQAVVDGWRVLIETPGSVLDYRVDARGRFRRCEAGVDAPGAGWLDPTR